MNKDHLFSMEILDEIKQQALWEFYTLINQSNKLTDISEQSKTFKAYISLGNNGSLVRSILKKWPWWSLETEDTNDCNFVWTEWLRPQVIEKFWTNERIGFLYSKVSGNHELTDKANLYLNLSSYYKSTGENERDFIPETYLVNSQNF